MTATTHAPTPWVYVRSEPGLLTVGFYDPRGKWQSDSDHDTKESAANRVAFLNGNANAELMAVLQKADNSAGPLVADESPEFPSGIVISKEAFDAIRAALAKVNS